MKFIKVYCYFWISKIEMVGIIIFYGLLRNLYIVQKEKGDDDVEFKFFYRENMYM